jgi:hypothetical protein
LSQIASARTHKEHVTGWSPPTTIVGVGSLRTRSVFRPEDTGGSSAIMAGEQTMIHVGPHGLVKADDDSTHEVTARTCWSTPCR